MDDKIKELEARVTELERQLSLIVVQKPLFKHWWSLLPYAIEKLSLSDLKSEK